MADSTSGAITVAESPGVVMATIADLAAYPEWVSAVTSVEVLETGDDGRIHTARFVMDAGMVKDTYVLAYDWAADGMSVSWELVEGQLQKSQHGSYVLTPRDGGTEVVYELAVDLHIPMIGLLKRKAEKVIINTALGELKKRVEA
ncbi:SRPBCC family protein [Tomitella fengzijianii]|uniref:SRPBCC family protein n=1 Tax=Tomitella fengzijianii TaxID=2597660 RepID=A0A516X483_9ACTN|nr:SRPBCC family protein [Tomitella fengzijianii]QDQ97889.1 SRPBCC family protein [Tomitella fengzijianii]